MIVGKIQNSPNFAKLKLQTDPKTDSNIKFLIEGDAVANRTAFEDTLAFIHETSGDNLFYMAFNSKYNMATSRTDINVDIYYPEDKKDSYGPYNSLMKFPMNVNEFDKSGQYEALQKQFAEKYAKLCNAPEHIKGDNRGFIERIREKYYPKS